jgi:hypothetical protein
MGQTDYPETSVTTNQRRETSKKIEALIYTVQEPEIAQNQKHTAWEIFVVVARSGSHVRYICICKCY